MRKSNLLVSPISGRNQKDPFLGKLSRLVPPRKIQNNPNTWNFHFIVGKGGVLVQAWVFGPREKVLSFVEKMRVNEYFVFWGFNEFDFKPRMGNIYSQQFYKVPKSSGHESVPNI